MNDCKHYKSLVPLPDNDEYICTKCGWKFSIIHRPDIELTAFLEKRGIRTQPNMQSLIEEAVALWISTKKAKERDKVKPPVFTEEDVKLVIGQAKVSEVEARIALIESKGDIARAILALITK